MSDQGGILYAETGLAKRSQVEQSLKIAIDALDVPCKFRVNLVLDRDGKKLGHAYIWISSRKVINALLGKNYDGTERVEIIEDPDWKPPKMSLEDALEQFHEEYSSSSGSSGSSSGSSSGGGSWADQPCESSITSQYVCPQISRELPPLTTISGYDYDADQLKYIRKEEGEDAPTKGKLDNLSEAYPPNVDEDCCEHVLVCRRVPNWVSKEDIQKLFRAYFSENSSRGSMNQPRNYPRVGFLDKGSHKMVFVTFHEDSSDAMMIYHMVRRINVYKPNPGQSTEDSLTSNEQPERFASLVFSFAYDNNNF